MAKDTIVALATPKGVSAFAVIRCSGHLSKRLFEKFSGIENPLPKLLYHCKYLSDRNDVLDDIMSVYFSGDSSYTGEDSLEIYCHGNMLIVEKILLDLCYKGCRSAEPGEFTRRAFLNGKVDLCQAEAVADIIHATNERAISVAKKQLDGILSDKLNDISRELLKILSKLEFDIDFANYELSEVSTLKFDDVKAEISAITCKLSDLIDSNKFRRVIEDGVETVIIGAPNVGKSSILNFLLDEDRAIVSDIPGTTRDVISEKVRIGNNFLKICDTAGIRSGNLCSIEQIGISKAISKSKQADLFLIVIDSSSIKLPDLPAEIINSINKKNSLLIFNKIDLGKADEVKNFLPNIERIEISIKTGENTKLLKEKINEIISKNDTISSDVDVVVNSRHVDILRRASDLLVQEHIEQSFSCGIETVASDIRQSLIILGEITGKYDNEKMLDLVFSSFCIGK